jgi:hypothetical protein
MENGIGSYSLEFFQRGWCNVNEYIHAPTALDAGLGRRMPLIRSSFAMGAT